MNCYNLRNRCDLRCNATIQMPDFRVRIYNIWIYVMNYLHTLINGFQ